MLEKRDLDTLNAERTLRGSTVEKAPPLRVFMLAHAYPPKLGVAPRDKNIMDKQTEKRYRPIQRENSITPVFREKTVF